MGSCVMNAKETMLCPYLEVGKVNNKIFFKCRQYYKYSEF